MNVASIDIGTNTILLLVAEADKKKNFIPLRNEYRMPRIGKGLKNNEKISRDKIIELFEVLKEFLHIAEIYSCEKVLAVGTNALRIAGNAEEIIKQIKSKFELDVKVVSGTEEAKLSFLGACSSSSSHEKIVIDIGGWKY